MKTIGIIDFEEEEKQNSLRVPIELNIWESLFEKEEAPV
jgi:hypothetical protein